MTRCSTALRRQQLLDIVYRIKAHKELADIILRRPVKRRKLPPTKGELCTAIDMKMKNKSAWLLLLLILPILLLAYPFKKLLERKEELEGVKGEGLISALAPVERSPTTKKPDTTKDSPETPAAITNNVVNNILTNAVVQQYLPPRTAVNIAQKVVDDGDKLIQATASLMEQPTEAVAKRWKHLRTQSQEYQNATEALEQLFRPHPIHDAGAYDKQLRHEKIIKQRPKSAPPRVVVPKVRSAIIQPFTPIQRRKSAPPRMVAQPKAKAKLLPTRRFVAKSESMMLRRPKTKAKSEPTMLRRPKANELISPPVPPVTDYGGYTRKRENGKVIKGKWVKK